MCGVISAAEPKQQLHPDTIIESPASRSKALTKAPLHPLQDTPGTKHSLRSALLSRKEMNSSVFPLQRLTVVVVRVQRLLPPTVVALSPLFSVASTRLSVEGLLFENLLLPGWWGRAGVVVETWEEV